MSLRFASQVAIDNLPDEQFTDQFEVIMPALDLNGNNNRSTIGQIFSSLSGMTYRPIVEEKEKEKKEEKKEKEKKEERKDIPFPKIDIKENIEDKKDDKQNIVDNQTNENQNIRRSEESPQKISPIKNNYNIPTTKKARKRSIKLI